MLLIPGIDRMVRVSLRTRTVGIPPQDVITRDNVTARVDAVAYFRVVDANSAVVSVEDAQKATLQIAQTTLRSVLGKADLDTLLSERERLNEHLQKIIDEQTEPWGIKATTVEIKDVSIPAGMQKAMSRQAEAERERRARIINADAEYPGGGEAGGGGRGHQRRAGRAAAALPADAARDRRRRAESRRSSSRSRSTSSSRCSRRREAPPPARRSRPTASFPESARIGELPQPGND